MTQPIQEPTVHRALAGSKWSENQLFRRPSLASGLQWGRAQFTTDQGATGTIFIQWDQAWVPAGQDAIVPGPTQQEIFSFEAVGFYLVHFWATWAGGETWGASEQHYLGFELDDTPIASSENAVLGPKQTGAAAGNRRQNAVTPAWFLGSEVIDPTVSFRCFGVHGTGVTRTLTQGGVNVAYLGFANPDDGGTAFS